MHAEHACIQPQLIFKHASNSQSRHGRIFARKRSLETVSRRNGSEDLLIFYLDQENGITDKVPYIELEVRLKEAKDARRDDESMEGRVSCHVSNIQVPLN